ncbi:hypothetical protein [Nocardia sp. CDC160]|uniref:hypothetical protein n=1 Tax=Nocardia sp. CDC160 TaxID=3112166 RepID=UPI002DBDB8F9|nr:hypothetical protein [Nocardia sp. CDC160]MEC3920315.1 hypothetical protein [Nocardia sp. CDC160]
MSALLRIDPPVPEPKLIEGPVNDEPPVEDPVVDDPPLEDPVCVESVEFGLVGVSLGDVVVPSPVGVITGTSAVAEVAGKTRAPTVAPARIPLRIRFILIIDRPPLLHVLVSTSGESDCRRLLFPARSVGVTTESTGMPTRRPAASAIALLAEA